MTFQTRSSCYPNHHGLMHTGKNMNNDIPILLETFGHISDKSEEINFTVNRRYTLTFRTSMTYMRDASITFYTILIRSSHGSTILESAIKVVSRQTEMLCKKKSLVPYFSSFKKPLTLQMLRMNCEHREFQGFP